MVVHSLLVVVLGPVADSCLVVDKHLEVGILLVVGIPVVDSALEVGTHQAVVVDNLDRVVVLHREVDNLAQVADNFLVVDMRLEAADMPQVAGTLLGQEVDKSLEAQVDLEQVDIPDNHLVVDNHLDLQVRVVDPIGLAAQEDFYCENQTYLAY